MTLKYQLPIETIITRLGYENSDNLVRNKDFSNSVFSAYTVKVLSEIKPYAVYSLDSKPFILFFDKLFDEKSFKQISKQVWNAQVPIAFFCDDNTVKVYNGTSLDMTSYLLNKVAEMDINDCTIYTDFSYWEISNPVFWSKYSSRYTSTKLNEYLLSNITFLTNKLKNKYHIKFATKLVLRLIFIRYLIDRGVDLAYGNFSNDIEYSKNELLVVMRQKETLYGLFAHLKSKFNGNLFDLGNEFDSPELTFEVFDLLADFLSGTLSLEDGQLSLFALYDFNIIPVELISNIYEILLGKEIRARDNAFYTPNYLVEYILDKTAVPFLQKNNKYKILDPACGSGVFLVDSYRRIIEQNLSNNMYCEDDTILKTFLTENIYGIDINEEAIDVTIFSLYLTILDYKDPKTLSKFTLPNLKGINLFVSDFFDEEKLAELKKVKFDFIIGNPPWGNVKEGLHISYCKRNGYDDKQQNNEISRSFVFRAKDFSFENTVCCFILHSKLLYNQKKPAKRFRRFLLEKTKIYNIVEMSSVRKQVFKNADAPAVIVTFKYCDEYNLNNRITYTSLKPNIFFKLFNIIVVEKNDVKYIIQNLLFSNDWAWKTIVYGFSCDINNVISLKKRYQALKQVLKTATPPFYLGTGIQDNLGDAQDASHLLGLILLDSDDGIEHFSIRTDGATKFDKPKIHRTRKKELFSPPYCITAKGLDCSNYKMRSAYSEDTFVCKETMYVIKGTIQQKDILLNLTGLLNSSFYSYMNLMLGSSTGIEREQRFMTEILEFPYKFSQDVANKVEYIQNVKKENEIFNLVDIDNEIAKLDDLILHVFGLENNKFVDYAVNIQIPELTNSKEINIYRKVSVDELMKYSECFERQFSIVYEKIDKHVSITLYPDVLKKFTVFELSICDEKPVQKIMISNVSDNNKDFLSKLCIYKHNDMFFQLRDVIHFEENSFFIIKPNYYKNWHPAVAELDLADVVDQIMSDNGGEQ